MAIEQDISLKGVKVHLKVDSGMGRIGVRSLDEAENLIANLKKLAQVSKESSLTLRLLMKLMILNLMNNLNSSQILLTIW